MTTLGGAEFISNVPIDEQLSIPSERVHLLTQGEGHGGDYVLYWMHASQRAEDNHALEYAVISANALRLPVLVLFCIIPSLPFAIERHYAFMLEGIDEVKRSLSNRGIGFIVRKGEPEGIVTSFSEDAALLVTDLDYVRRGKAWRERIFASVTCPVTIVETNVVVPLGVTSKKEEYSAATIRPKIWKHALTYLVAPHHEEVIITSSERDETELLHKDRRSLLGTLAKTRTRHLSSSFKGGTSVALRLLSDFVEQKLSTYASLRNDPAEDSVSHLSPYLHFGQISPVTVASTVLGHQTEGVDAFLEELVVRRELAMNYVHYNPNYDTLAGVSSWARATLEDHADDRREHIYSFDELENARTHDAYWNAAQKEMVHTGTMHGYMRMYWGKKILEWSETPADAFSRALELNNRYELDGRDPNGYAGIAWCFGNHDRPWKERPVFGKVRYMNDRGLERKFDMSRYVERMETYP